MSVLPTVLFLAITICWFPSAGRDDTYITLWPAHTLAEYGEILNYNGERVEQSSTLLMVLLLAPFAVWVPNLATVARVLSLLAGVGCIVVLQRAYRDVTPWAGQRERWIAALSTATAFPFSYWSTSGMETTLTALMMLLFWGVGSQFVETRAKATSVIMTAVVTASALMVRPEVPLVILCAVFATFMITGWRAWADSSPERAAARTSAYRVLVLFVVALGLTVALFAVRYAYFSSVFPQPVAAKSNLDFDLLKISRGLHYLWRGSPFFPENQDGVFPFLLPAAALALLAAGWISLRAFRSHPSPPDLLLAMLFLSSLAFIVTNGGDWMEGVRLYAHVLPMGMLLAVRGLQRIAASGPSRVVRRESIAVATLVVVQVAGAYSFASNGSQSLTIHRAGATVSNSSSDRWTWTERTNLVHLRDLGLIERLDSLVTQLRRNRPDTPVTIWTYQMGLASYTIAQHHRSHVQFVDLLGLGDRRITDCDFFMDAPRTSIGVIKALNPGFWTDDWSSVLTRCPSLPSPDVVYILFLGRFRSDWEIPGFHRFYQQDRLTTAWHSDFYTNSGAVLYLRDYLYEDLGSPSLTRATPIVQ